MQLSFEQMHALTEIIQRGSCTATATLNSIVDTHISVQVSGVEATVAADAEGHPFGTTTQVLPFVRMSFKGSLSGHVALVMSRDAVAQLAAGVSARPPGMDPLAVDTVTEIGNVVLHSVLTGLSQTTGRILRCCPAVYCESTLADLLAAIVNSTAGPGVLAFAETKLVLDDIDIPCEILMMLGVGSLHTLVAAARRAKPTSGGPVWKRRRAVARR